MKKASFSQIVSGAEGISNAFDLYPAARLWWRVIMWLHGKPSASHIGSEERRQVVAAGFRFYAQLYRFLAVLFWFVGAAVWHTEMLENPRDALYWSAAAGLAGAFLWFASGLGFTGSKALQEHKATGRLLLGTFMVCAISFLSALVGVLSLMVQAQTSVGVEVNLGALALVWAFGIGSYLIEVLYLMSHPQPD